MKLLILLLLIDEDNSDLTIKSKDSRDLSPNKFDWPFMMDYLAVGRSLRIDV